MASKKTETVWAVIIDDNLSSVCKSEAGAVARANTYLTKSRRAPVERVTGTMWLSNDDDLSSTVTVQRYELYD